MQRGTVGLTARQELYLRAMCRGQTIAAITEAEFVSRQTVKNALSTAYRALGVRGAIQACYELGRVDQQRSMTREGAA